VTCQDSPHQTLKRNSTGCRSKWNTPPHEPGKQR